jgi:protein involved in polysaccharide export with SLBB domain
VRITGQVRNPGTYAYRQEMTVSDLLFQGGGLADDEYLKEVFKQRADLYREADDGGAGRVIPFHLGRTLEGEGAADRELQPGDEIRVYPIDVEVLRDKFVRISGAVKKPGRYDFRRNLTLKDLILQAEGFEEGAYLKNVEVTRQPDSSDSEERAITLQVPLQRSPEGDYSFAMSDTTRAMRMAEDFTLQHRDQVFVRTDPSFEEQRTVTLRGEVRYPGEYTLTRDNERLSDVIDRAGGVLGTGYPKGGRLFRNDEQVIVEMREAIRGRPGSDVILQADDEVFIPPKPNTVAIRGNVANEGLLKFQPGRRVSYYLERAGGKGENTQAIFLTQASGATFRIEDSWFRRTPVVDDGAVIRVEEKPQEQLQEEQIDVGQTARDVVGILSSALTVIVLATRAFGN